VLHVETIEIVADRHSKRKKFLQCLLRILEVDSDSPGARSAFQLRLTGSFRPLVKSLVCLGQAANLDASRCRAGKRDQADYRSSEKPTFC
jgi:hypothetical protein